MIPFWGVLLAPPLALVDLINPNMQGIGDLLEGGDEVVAGNGGDLLLQGQGPPLTLLQEMPGSNLVGDVDRKRDYDGAPAVGVDAAEGCAPPVRLLPWGVVTELA